MREYVFVFIDLVPVDKVKTYKKILLSKHSFAKNNINATYLINFMTCLSFSS